MNLILQSGSLDFNEIATIASAAIALLALILSLWSVLLSKRAVRLAEIEHENRKPSFILYLQDSLIRYSTPKEPFRVYGLLLSISNTSDSDNSLSTIDLFITLSQKSETILTLKIPLDANLGDFVPNNSSVLTVPLRIDAHQTVVGWCFFRLADTASANAEVEVSRLVVKDAQGNKTEIEHTLFIPFLTRDELE